MQADAGVVEFATASGLASKSGVTLFIPQPSRAGAQAAVSVAKGPDGSCVFRQNRRCSLHARGGESALPVGCRQYPRVVRIDPAGISLSLSHYCPTAASLLADLGELRIVRAAAPLALDEPVDGLDARDALPPLLRPHLLMDVHGYTAWERAAVDAFAGVRRPDRAFAVLHAATEYLREWRPGITPLTEAVADGFAQAAASAPPMPLWRLEALPIARALNRGLVPLGDDEHLEDRWAAATGPSHENVCGIISNYLAARTFGNWIAYQGRGLRTIVLWLHACHDIVRLLACRAAELRGGPVSVRDAIEAIRHADYVMLHTIDTQEFANAAQAIER